MAGIHHVTAIAGNGPRNYEFYTRTLGLRFVKKTVNFDDPGTYHFYYGDETGTPGSILTFFPWEGAAPGRGGVGQTQQTAFRVPVGSLGGGGGYSSGPNFFEALFGGFGRPEPRPSRDVGGPRYGRDGRIVVR